MRTDKASLALRKGSTLPNALQSLLYPRTKNISSTDSSHSHCSLMTLRSLDQWRVFWPAGEINSPLVVAVLDIFSSTWQHFSRWVSFGYCSNFLHVLTKWRCAAITRRAASLVASRAFRHFLVHHPVLEDGLIPHSPIFIEPLYPWLNQ